MNRHSKSSRRYYFANALSTGTLFKCLITVLILLTFFVVEAGNQPVDTESADALFIDERGNVGIGTNQPKAALDVNGKVRALELEGDGSALTFLVPEGAIIAWHPGVKIRSGGKEIKAPKGWAICDGENGTPDLRGQFLRGLPSHLVPDFLKNPAKSFGEEYHDHGTHNHRLLNFKERPPDRNIPVNGSTMSSYTTPSTVPKAPHLPPYVYVVYIMKVGAKRD